MLRKGFLFGWLAVGTVAISSIGGAALAALAPAEAVKVRKHHFNEMGANFKAINDTLRRPDPDLPAVRRASAEIRKSSLELPSWFPRGTGPEAGEKTRVKPAVWSDRAGFAAASKRFQTEAAKLATVANGKDVDAIKAQAKVMGGECAACHNDFRNK